MELSDYRKELDSIDAQMLELFKQRMNTVRGVAEYKKENKLPVLQQGREREILAAAAAGAGEELEDYARTFFATLMDVSRSYQERLTAKGGVISETITDALKNTPPIFPKHGTVACQGVEGAYSQLACDKVFTNPNIFYFKNFEAVFTAIEKGLCRYGVIPLENSTAGSVNKVYDLMMKHRFSIIKSVRIKIDHNLLALPGTKLSDIKEIYSHEQAISQCSAYLQSLTGVKVIACENTAEAARMVAESGRHDIAAISSFSCVKLYGLECLASSIQDKGNNYTRFICISKNLEIYPGANRTSLMMVLPHTPGSLYKALSRFYALGINLNKLESRPLPDRDFEFMFYFDLDVPVYSPNFVQLMGEIQDICEQFEYLGSYSEVI